MNKIIASLKNLFLILIMISTVISCSKEKIDVKIPVTAIKLSSELEALDIDGEIVLKANILPENATNKNIIWSSGDSKIATVDKNGKVHAVSAGTAVVTVKAEGSKISSTCKITVKAAYIPIEEIAFAETVKSIVIGETFTPEVKITPEDATDKTLVWSSSNEEIASVDDKGLVTSKKIGEVTISAKSINDKKTATYTVGIVAAHIPIKEIAFRESIVNMGLNDTFMPAFTITPSKATDKTLVWSSSDVEIASVDDKGLVTSKKEGEVTITGTSTKDKISASYTLKVKYVFISIFNIFFREREVTIVEGSTYTPELDIYPQNRNENIVWTSSNSDVARVDDKGVVTAIKSGDVTITALGEKSKKGGSYTLKVVDTHIPVVEIKFNDYNDKTLAIGYKNSLSYFVLPQNATDKRLIWTSSNSDIASVDDKGVVTGKQLGDVVITATSVKDNIVSTYNLKVENLNFRFEFETSFKMVYVGDQFNQGVQIYPYYASNINLTWTSSDEEVATVNNRGGVTTKKVGRTRITVSYNEFSSYFDVEVVADTEDKVNIKFTDEAFKNALIESGVDKNRDGEISEDEALMVGSIRFYKKGITDISEITYFKNIEYLYCGNNDLSEVDITQNTKLTYINFYYNKNLKSLDLSKNTELKEIDLYAAGIESLDLSKNTKLRDISCPSCKLTALDVSFCVNLEKIDCAGNSELKEVFVFDKKLADSSSDFKKGDSTNWVEKKN